MAAPAQPHSPEHVPILDHFGMASPEPATDSDHMDADSDGDISSNEGSNDCDSSDDDDTDDDLMMDDNVEGIDTIDGDDPVDDVQGVEDDEYDHPTPLVLPPVVEDEVAPIPEPDHEVPTDVEDEVEDPKEDPIVDLEDAPLVQPDPHDIDLDDEPIEIIDVMDDALPEDADPDDDDDEDVDIDGLAGEEFVPGWLLAEGMMFGDFDPWLDFMPADVLTIPKDEMPPVVTNDETNFYASLH